jgi:hypothetical protein
MQIAPLIVAQNFPSSRRPNFRAGKFPSGGGGIIYRAPGEGSGCPSEVNLDECAGCRLRGVGVDRVASGLGGVGYRGRDEARPGATGEPASRRAAGERGAQAVLSAPERGARARATAAPSDSAPQIPRPFATGRPCRAERPGHTFSSAKAWGARSRCGVRRLV